MADETYTFEAAKVRLEEIAAQVRKKDTSLERSLDLLEEGVRLANLCTEQIDHTQWRVADEPAEDDAAAETDATAEDAATGDAGADVDGPASGEAVAPADAGVSAEDVEAPNGE
jgi:exodeoxyribonuclease VII small subunit